MLSSIDFSVIEERGWKGCELLRLSHECRLTRSV
jgi:hypothetical protein